MQVDIGAMIRTEPACIAACNFYYCTAGPFQTELSPLKRAEVSVLPGPSAPTHAELIKKSSTLPAKLDHNLQMILPEQSDDDEADTGMGTSRTARRQGGRGVNLQSMSEIVSLGEFPSFGNFRCISATKLIPRPHYSASALWCSLGVTIRWFFLNDLLLYKYLNKITLAEHLGAQFYRISAGGGASHSSVTHRRTGSGTAGGPMYLGYCLRPYPAPRGNYAVDTDKKTAVKLRRDGESGWCISRHSGTHVSWVQSCPLRCRILSFNSTLFVRNTNGYVLSPLENSKRSR